MADDLRLSVGLDNNGFVSGMRSIQQQAAKSMAALQKSYQMSAQADKGLNDSRIQSRANLLRNLGVQEQEVQKFIEVATVTREYKKVQADLRTQYGANTEAVNAGIAAYERETATMSRAAIAAKELEVAHKASAARVQYKTSTSAPDEADKTIAASGIVTSLASEQAALGKTSAELKVLQLRSLGASEAQLATATAAQKAIDSYNTEQKALASRNAMMRSSITTLKSMALATLGITGISGLATLSDEWTTFNNKLKLVTHSEEELTTVRQKLIDISSNTGQSLETVTTIYQRLAQAQDTVKLSGDQLATVTDTVAKAMVIGGGATMTQEAALTQFGQALARGVLSGQELHSVLLEAPGLAQALAKGLGVPVSKLQELGSASELTSQVIARSLLKVAPEISQKFETADKTISMMINSLKVKFVAFIGEVNQSSGSLKVIVKTLEFMADHIEGITTAITVLLGLKFIKFLATAAIETTILTGTLLLEAKAADTAAIATGRFGGALLAVKSGAFVASLKTITSALITVGATIGGALLSYILPVVVAVTTLSTAFYSLYKVMKGEDASNWISRSFDSLLKKLKIIKNDTDTFGTWLYGATHKDDSKDHYVSKPTTTNNKKTPNGNGAQQLDADARTAVNGVVDLGKASEETAKKLKDTVAKEVNDYAVSINKLALMRKGYSEQVAGKLADASVSGMSGQQYKNYAVNLQANEQALKNIADFSFVQKYIEDLHKQEAAAGKSADALTALELSAHNASPEIIKMAIASKNYIENQKFISDYVKNLEDQAQDATMQTAANGNKDALIAMQLSARNASAATIRQAQAANKVVEAYQRQQAVMTTLESLQDQVATLGMSDTQKQLYELQKQNANPQQLQQAQSLLARIDAFNKAQEQSKDAADKLDNSGDNLKSAADKLKTGADSLKESADKKDKMSLSEQMRADDSTYQKNLKNDEISVITGAKTDDMDVTAQNVSLPNAKLQLPPVSGNLTGGLGAIGSIREEKLEPLIPPPEKKEEKEENDGIYTVKEARFETANFANVVFPNGADVKNATTKGSESVQGTGGSKQSYELVLMTPDGFKIQGNYVTDKNFDAFLKKAIGRMARDK